MILKKTTKTQRIIIGAVILSAIIVLAIVLLNKPHKKWERVTQVYMNDFNGDGKKQEMLIMCKPCYYESDRPCETSSAMKLINVETEEEIWTSETRPHRQFSYS